MATIAPGVEFDTVAREWRCKWSADNDKASLANAQEALNSVLPDIKGVDGFLKVDRVVCGGCLDFKVCAMHKDDAQRCHNAKKKTVSCRSRVILLFSHVARCSVGTNTSLCS